MAWKKIKRVSKDRELWVLYRVNPRTKKKYVSWGIAIEKWQNSGGKSWLVAVMGKNKKRRVTYYSTKEKGMKFVRSFKKSH
tara:strand:+ start:624 stop:866 length:243 start_codon:yes stop_codon:yes gene_type:complete